jgi:pimeloyl-ACP methyl ester carboxylesterase
MIIRTILSGLILGPLLIALRANRSVAQAPPPVASGYSAVPIDGTELRQIYSSRVGQEYLLKIRFPEGYEQSEERYPVLYLLDGDHAFAMATDIVQYLEYDRNVPQLIIVSPAYGSKNTPQFGGTNQRNRDLLPFPRPGLSDAPGAENYLRFLREELIPYVDATFRTDPANRTLWGYSAGSQFGLYTLVSQPELFARYILVDGFPAEILEVEAAYATKRPDLPAIVFLSSGIARPEITRFLTQLRERGYPNLLMEYARLAGVTHFALGAEGLTRGLKYVFNRKSIFEEMLRTIEEADLASAITLYHERKKAAPQAYNWAEAELDQLGQALLLMWRVEDAIAIYKMNVEAYPDAWKPYNSLADAYLRNGDTTRAIANFERSLSENPQNAHAAEMLRRLVGSAR